MPYETCTKRAELVQKFVPRSCFRSFRNKRTRYTPLDTKLMFWCILYYFGAFGTVGCPTELGAKRAEQVQKFMPRSCVGIFRNESTRSNPLDPKLTFWCVSYHVGAFGTVWLPYETCAKWAELVRSCHKVVSEFFATNRHGPTHWTLN